MLSFTSIKSVRLHSCMRCLEGQIYYEAVCITAAPIRYLYDFVIQTRKGRRCLEPENVKFTRSHMWSTCPDFYLYKYFWIVFYCQYFFFFTIIAKSLTLSKIQYYKQVTIATIHMLHSTLPINSLLKQTWFKPSTYVKWQHILVTANSYNDKQHVLSIDHHL